MANLNVEDDKQANNIYYNGRYLPTSGEWSRPLIPSSGAEELLNEPGMPDHCRMNHNIIF